MASNDLAEAQSELRFAYRSASIGQIYSGLVWLVSAAAWTIISTTAGVVALLAGGFLIYPVTTLLSRAFGNPGAVSATNPLREASLTIPAVGVLTIPVAGAAGFVDIGWFYPAFMVVMGAHYLPFSHLYGMPVFMPLGGAMWIMGIAFAFWATEVSVLGAYMTGFALVVVGVWAARLYRVEFASAPS